MAALLIFSTFWAFFIAFFIYQFEKLEGIQALSDYSLYEIPSVVYDVKGRKITEFYLYKRELINYKDIPETLIHTLLEAEDKNFFEHEGVDALGIIRAFFKNLSAGRVKQGGSTLTQQLAKLLFTTRERTIARKLKEFWITLQIESKYTKKEIIEKYLNKVYYGNNLYGVEAASQFYFGKPVSRLNYAESAFLVAIPPAPSYLNPLKYPLRTRERQSFILSKLVKAGYLSAEEEEKQFRLFWVNFQERLINGDFYTSRLAGQDEAPYFSEYIRRLMMERFSEEIYTGGYRIYTTLDIDKQKVGEAAMKKQLHEQKMKYIAATQNIYEAVQENYPRQIEFLSYAFLTPELEFYKSELEKEAVKQVAETEALNWLSAFYAFNQTAAALIFEKKDSAEFTLDYVPEGALVSLEVPSGRIISMVGGSGYTPFNQLNRVYQSRRQPGSSFKPFVYLMGLLSKKFSAASVVNDIPLAYKIEDDEIWTPQNAGKDYSGRIRVREALKKSVNIVSIRMLEAISLEVAIPMMARMLSIPLERMRTDFSLALGTSEFTPLEMAKGYAVLANMGKDVIPHAILRVEDRRGKIVWNPESEVNAQEKEQIVPPEFVYILNDMMKAVIQPGGTAAGAAARADFHYPAAGKTGTSSNFKDAWFSGFTPHVATSVWVGFDRGTTLGIWETGGKVAAPIWMEFMKTALKDYPNSEFPYPGGLIRFKVCTNSGLIPGQYCQETVDELFIPETLPTKECDICETEYNVSDKELDKIDILE